MLTRNIIIYLGALVLLSGCADDSSWYDKSRETKERKAERIEQIMREQGVSEVEASRQWNGEYWKERTETDNRFNSPAPQ